eukprot:TRINITY_DN12059_c0_g1_i2.p1 TRINITY_DN12059_c0_g1~~TRINITY_DN12059_c0_g1_i2.p1  ORF type:complete len:241 (-),score=64.74 TRINITY_DN12059_c0_g1_i2:3-725(-)
MQLCCLCFSDIVCNFFFFFQAEDGIRDVERSRGLGDVYKRQVHGYGRVGAPRPQTSLLKFYSFQEAQINFEKKFYEKTMNYWADRTRFRHIEAKYYLVQAEKISNAEEEAELATQEKELKEALESSWKRESKLSLPIQDLMNAIWDLARMQKTMKELNFDIQKFPLGRLSKAQIQKGFVVLSQIQDALVKNCLLYTSDAADDTPCVGLGGRRIIKKKKEHIIDELSANCVKSEERDVRPQ